MKLAEALLQQTGQSDFEVDCMTHEQIKDLLVELSELWDKDIYNLFFIKIFGDRSASIERAAGCGGDETIMQIKRVTDG